MSITVPAGSVTPSQKSPQVEAALTSIAGKNRLDTIRDGSCMTCDGRATEFTDTLSVKEYSISGCCQRCQDAVFGVAEEEC
jgi:hypothetical protein